MYSKIATRLNVINIKIPKKYNKVPGLVFILYYLYICKCPNKASLSAELITWRSITNAANKCKGIYFNFNKQ